VGDGDGEAHGSRRGQEISLAASSAADQEDAEFEHYQR